MDKFELVRALHLESRDFVRGVARISCDWKTVLFLQERDALEKTPQTKQCSDFIINNRKKDIALEIIVIDPNRDDFRVEVKGVSVNSDYAKLNTQEDMMFWRDFMSFGRVEDAEFSETEEYVSWQW